MPIWKRNFSLEELQKWSANTAAESLAIEFTAIGDDTLTARMPVDARTVQPLGVLHGGASVLLAETVGSCAANLCVEGMAYCVGLDINANHLRPVRDGWVTATAKPFHIGRTTHVWEIQIVNDAGDLVCISRITMAVVDRKQ
ncbi:MAG: hotdog fold thioesterase [Burkholderiales bacterium]|nr:hotdog fold thioesterase [Burkholderiales bacterium]